MEKFVRLCEDSQIAIDLKYKEMKIPEAVATAYVRESVAKMLKQAANLLPQHYRLLIWDAWRPYNVQSYLYQYYQPMVREEYPNLSEEEFKKVMTKFVSLPVTDKSMAPLHTTGGAVDLTIIDDKNHPIDMGTGFDSMTDSAATAYEDLVTEQKENRLLLKSVMEKSGFINLPSEWWHYDYGNKKWQEATGQSIIYNGVFTEAEVLKELK